ncbi:MAG: hypothetical protein ABIF19_08030 [Planctomycetota bacterium]
MKNIKRLKAAYKEDIPAILEKLKMRKAVEDGVVYCAMCGQTISFDNLGVIIPREGGNIESICNAPECIEQANIYKTGD